MERVITVVINHQAFNDGTIKDFGVENQDLKTCIEEGYKIKEFIPLTNLQDNNAGISVITFILEPIP